MNLYYNCFKYGNYFRGGSYLFDNKDDGAKTLGDSKPKHYHIYMYTENKVKNHNATISVYVFITSSLYCYIDAKILICYR